ncbi:MAG: amino acid kinase family protein, partial [Candidatus Kariarchaeaceae archaeon]
MVEVYKFGGTCMENTSKLETVTQIIKNSEKPLVVTVSAAAGVTNQLKLLLDSELTEVTISEILTKLRERHIQLSHLEQAPPEIEEALQRLERLLQGISYTEDISPRIISLIMSFGERLIGPVLQTYLKKEGLKSQI